MGRKRNEFGQFIKADSLAIRVPGPSLIFQLLLLLIIISPWLYVIFFRIDAKLWFLSFINFIFKVEEIPKKNGLFK